MTTVENVSQTGTDYLYQLERAGARFHERTAQREETCRTIDRRGVLYADDPDRVTKRLARLNADWSLARSVERMETVPRTTTGSTLPLGPNAFGADVLGLERLMGRNDLTGVAFLEGGHLASRPIGRIALKVPGGVRHGTGFMVSPSLLMTNNHVLRTADEAARAVIEFNFQAGLDGRPLNPAVFPLEPQKFFATDRDLDFTVVAVAGRNQANEELAEFHWLPLDGAEGKAVLGEFVNIIQHPNGEPKQLALRENQIVDVLDRFLHYVTDTAPGSSGSPVFNDQWEVVALHHSAVPKTDGEGRLLAVDGSLWQPGMGEHRLAWKANEGVRISSVLRTLSRLTLTGTAARLRDELFRAPGTPQTAPGVPPGPTDTVSVVEDAARRDLDAALLNLRLGEELVYYDAPADAAARDAYYAGVDAGADGEELRRALTELLEETHERRPSYKPSRMVYPWVDLHPDRQLRSVYSGKTFGAEEFIRADTAAETARLRGLQEFLLRESSVGPAELAAELDALEASLPFNCEHVVPQSWFHEREPMRGDLHHLFACEVACNSFRSNIPYMDFPQFDEVHREDCGLREDNGFEPEHHRGAVARATLYFLLRYPKQVGDTKELTRDRLPSLLTWHEREPVTEYELHRNAAIAEIQGNRNPFIDHPEWAAAVDFSEVWA
ncbi:endonuclease [Streptomyces sp. MJP52]|uniref:endonuclease n=1 Tax=Streptomyces sp. MJP52 TaxID=2940555 RepID=UPI0024772067|nr:endonuclease [Streptomyces sp. MJP52]MDH6229031.1 endonuclease G [Streptomyces sp. MJP52]